MSDLPEAIGRAHRGAIRNHLAKQAGKNQDVKPSSKPSKQDKTGKQERPDQGIKQTDIVAFNQGAEKYAIEYMTRKIREKGSVSFGTACALLALEIDVSTETAKRYLRKYSVDHPRAPFSIADGYVSLRGKS
jgi:hypothetical protein